MLEQRASGGALASQKSERQAQLEAHFTHLLQLLVDTDNRSDDAIQQLLALAVKHHA